LRYSKEQKMEDGSGPSLIDQVKGRLSRPTKL
jgi:hypothetical protein